MEILTRPSGQKLLYGVAVLCLHLSLLMGRCGYSSKHMENLSRHYTKLDKSWNVGSAYSTYFVTFTRVQGMAVISISIISWLIVGYGLCNNTGPPLLGADSVFAAGLVPSRSAAALTQALILSLVASIALGAISEGLTLSASLLLTAVITGIVVPVSARTIWHSDGMFTAEGNMWNFIANGVGVIDAGGGGIIHCTAGIITLALCLVVSPAYAKAGMLDCISDPTSSTHFGQVVQSSGFFWAGFALVHGVSLSDIYSVKHAVSYPEMAALATIFSGCVGCLMAMFQTYWMRPSWKYNDVASAWARALRVSVVTASASCTVVPIWSHLLTIPLAVITARTVHRRLRWIPFSEASAVVTVHLVGGVFSMVSVGVFARSDLLLALPLMPSEAATQWSEGIVFGGSGQQLAAQLLWLTFNIIWSLLLVVPVAFILRSLGVLMDDPQLHVSAVMHEATRDVINAVVTSAKDMLHEVWERVRGLWRKKDELSTSAVSLYHFSAASTKVPGRVPASCSSSAGSQDWRPLKAHVAMHEAIRIFQQQEEGAWVAQRDNFDVDASEADAPGSSHCEIQRMPSHYSAVNAAALLGTFHQSGTSAQTNNQCRHSWMQGGSSDDICGLSGSNRLHSPSETPSLSGRSGSTGVQSKTTPGAPYSGVLSPLTAAIMLANDVTYKPKSSGADME